MPMIHTVMRSLPRAFGIAVLILSMLGSEYGSSADDARDRIVKAPKGRPTAAPFLKMPAVASDPLPTRLSETGAFQNTQNLSPAPALMEYELNVPFWSDG